MHNVGVDKHNPVKTSSEQARDFFSVMCVSKTKKLTHRVKNSIEKTFSVHLEKGQKSTCIFFCSHL